MQIQLPLPIIDASYYDLIDKKNCLVRFILILNTGRMTKILNKFYAPIGPKGFPKISFLLMDFIKIKRNIPSNRKLISELKQQRLLQHLAGLAVFDKLGRYRRKYPIPTHQAISKFHRSVGVSGFRELLKLSVEEADELGLLSTPTKYHRDGIHLTSDSTFMPIRTTYDTFLKRRDSGIPQTIDIGISSKYSFPLGCRIHLLLTIPRRIIVDLEIAEASKHDSNFTLPLIERFTQNHKLKIAYHIADGTCGSDEIRKTLFEKYNIIGIYPLREDSSFPDNFSQKGRPLCSFGFPLKRKGTDYKRRRTQYYCNRICLNLAEYNYKGIRSCPYLVSKKKQGFTFYTKFKNGLGKFGPIDQSTKRFERLYDSRTYSEQVIGLTKSHRYHMEHNLTATDPEEITIQALLHAIILNYDEIVNERLKKES